jgi:hypothetical protein
MGIHLAKTQKPVLCTGRASVVDYPYLGARSALGSCLGLGKSREAFHCFGNREIIPLGCARRKKVCLPSGRLAHNGPPIVHRDTWREDTVGGGAWGRTEEG